MIYGKEITYGKMPIYGKNAIGKRCVQDVERLILLPGRLYPELPDFPEKCFIVDFEKRGRPGFFLPPTSSRARRMAAFFRILD